MNTRRNLLQYAGASTLLAGLRPLYGAEQASTFLRIFRVGDAVAAPAFTTGQLLVADTACTRFESAGVYLYPAWGSPRPYLVTGAPGALLEFRNPATGVLLWVQSANLEAEFAGRVREGSAQHLRYPPLRVPVLPPSHGRPSAPA